MMTKDHLRCWVVLSALTTGCTLLPTKQTACSKDRPCPGDQRCNPTTSICEPVDSQPDLSLLTDFAAPLDLSATPQGMVYVPGGTFMMGDNLVPYAQPVHQQAVAAFYLDITEVTVNAYQQCITVGNCMFKRVSSFVFPWLVLALAVFVLVSGLGPATAHADQADQHYKRALRYYESKDYPRAIKEFQAAYRVRQLPRILLNIGQVYRKLGMASTALKFYEHYLRVEPNPKPEIKAEVDRYIAQTHAMLDPPEFVSPPSSANMSPAEAAAAAVAAATIPALLAPPLLRRRVGTTAAPPPLPGANSSPTGPT